jgi:hypothetical protein
MIEGQTRSLTFNVHGLRAAIEGDWPEVVTDLGRDFAWFHQSVTDGPADVRVTIEQRAPAYDGFGDAPAAYVTAQHAVYRLGDRTVIDYLGRVLSVIDERGTHALVQGQEPRLARRAAFDFLLARVSDHLDTRGLPRVLGLGLGGVKGAVLILLPPGGGKTTLALRALTQEGVEFFSETSPLLDRRGNMHPFPFPLWIRGDSPEATDLPERYVRHVKGPETDLKLLELEAFAEKVAARPLPLRHIVLAQRSLARDSRLEMLGRRHAVPPLLRQSVLGFPLSDALRFLVRRGGARDPAKEQRDGDRPGGPQIASSATRALTRSRCCAAALTQATVWKLTLGHDRAGNWKAIEHLFR